MQVSPSQPLTGASLKAPLALSLNFVFGRGGSVQVTSPDRSWEEVGRALQASAG